MSALSLDVNEENKTDGRSLLGNWVEEVRYHSFIKIQKQRATALLDRSGPDSSINKNGHMGILTMDVTAKVQGVSTFRSAFDTPQSFGVRKKGRRTELLEKDLIKRISDQIHAELNPDPPANEWSSVSKSDFRVEGFKSVQALLTKDHNYTTDQAITFWSENYQKIQGMTAIKTKDSPFKRNATFSTPITERMDCQDDAMLNPSANDSRL
ncbi:sperm-associated antigen 8 isoform X1 [Misgurnus anguillicaudatus]|uniref:sperm-associated antigen 8 isoform X1 n=1 Tax=Misgurnus anguillicaudatus TaxID=75329 RepID=UPI003CCF5F70